MQHNRICSIWTLDYLVYTTHSQSYVITPVVSVKMDSTVRYVGALETDFINMYKPCLYWLL